MVKMRDFEISTVGTRQHYVINLIKHVALFYNSVEEKGVLELVRNLVAHGDAREGK